MLSFALYHTLTTPAALVGFSPASLNLANPISLITCVPFRLIPFQTAKPALVTCSYILQRVGISSNLRRSFSLAPFTSFKVLLFFLWPHQHCIHLLWPHQLRCKHIPFAHDHSTFLHQSECDIIPTETKLRLEFKKQKPLFLAVMSMNAVIQRCSQNLLRTMTAYHFPGRSYVYTSCIRKLVANKPVVLSSQKTSFSANTGLLPVRF